MGEFSERGTSERYQKRIETAANRGNLSSDNACPAYHELQENNSWFLWVDIQNPVIYHGRIYGMIGFSIYIVCVV